MVDVRAPHCSSSIVLGLAAGARTTAAPMLAHRVLRARPLSTDDRLVRFAQSDRLGLLLSAGAMIELVIDKLPGVGDRTAAVGVAARAISGAVSSATFAAADGRSRWIGAVLGGAAAIAGTYALFHARRGLQRRTPLPGFAIALAEDALVYGLGRAVLR